LRGFNRSLFVVLSHPQFISYLAGALCQLGNTPLFFFFTLGGMTSHFFEMWATYA
jgi:hypothetical protein